MAKININFNNTNYTIDEASLSTASAALKSHLSTVMNGTGAVINLGGTSYGIDSAKLSAAKNDFVSHLGTVSGSGLKVTIGGGEQKAFEPIVWDGNAEGKEVMELGDGNYYVKISDEYVDPTQIDIISCGNGSQMPVSYLVPTDFGFAASNELFMGVKDSVTTEIGTFGRGIWTMYIEGYNIYITEITPKTTILPPVEYSIDPTKLSGAVAELETVLGGLNSGSGSEYVVLIPETKYEFESYTVDKNRADIVLPFVLADGDVYRIIWNGVEYIESVKSSRQLKYLGNSKWTIGGVDTGQPFFIGQNTTAGWTSIYVNSDITEATMAITTPPLM